MHISRSTFCVAMCLTTGGIGGELRAEGPILSAVDHLTEELAEDTTDLSKETKSLIITAVETPAEFTDKLRPYVLKRVEQALKNKNLRIIHCKQCRTPRAEIQGDKIVIRKGLTDRNEIKKVAKDLKAESHAEVQFLYTGTKAKLAINTYRVSDGSVSWAQTYDTRLLTVKDTATQIAFTLAQFSGLSRNGYPAGASIFYGERVFGVGSIGLGVLGAKEHGDFRNYVAAGPLAFLSINEMFAMPWTWGESLLSLRLHYGWYGKKHRDLLVGLGTKLVLWSTYHLTLEGLTARDLNAEESEDDYSDSDKGLFLNTKMPNSLMLGFGFDIG